MKSCCLKCRKDTENIIPKFPALVMVKQWSYQNVQYVIGKNQDLSEIKKQKDY